MIKKVYKRWAIIFALLAVVIVPFLFWLGGWNFERNQTGVGCVVLTFIVAGFGAGVIMGVGYDNRDYP